MSNNPNAMIKCGDVKDCANCNAADTSITVPIHTLNAKGHCDFYDGSENEALRHNATDGWVRAAG